MTPIPKHKRAGAGNVAPDSASEDRYRQLFLEDLNGIAVHELICDSAGCPIDYRFLDVNPAFETQTGLRASDIVGKRVLEVIPDLEPVWIERYGRVALTGVAEQFDSYNAALDRHFLVRAYRPAAGQFAVVVQDVTTIRERTAFVETIVASSGEGIVVYDRDLRIVVWNPVMEELTGLPAAVVVGKGAHETFPEVMAAGVGEDLVRALTADAPTSREFEYSIPRTGRTGWVVQTNRPQRSAGGEVVGVVSSVRDITARHELDEATRRSEEERLRDEEARREQARFLQELIDAMPMPIVAKGNDGRVQLANAAFAAGAGHRREEIIGQTIAELGGPDADKHAASDGRVLDSGVVEAYEADFAYADGRPPRQFLTKAPLRSQDGTITGVVTAGVDISDRYQAEQALRKSEQKFRNLFDLADDGIFIIGLDDKLLEVNRTTCERLGYSRDELLTMAASDIDAPGFQALRPARHEALMRRGSAFFETAHVRRDGSVFPVEINATVVDLGGREVILSVARDISERRQAEAERVTLEEELRQAQKMEGIGRLAGGIAHDFNNLLTAIRGNASLALAELPPDAPAREDLQQIEQASDRAAALTRQLLAFARRTVLQPEVVDLGDIVRRLEPMLRRLLGEDVTLVTVTPPSGGSVVADPSKIEQVIVNLAVNARDAMPDGGTLTIETADVNLDESAVRGHPTATTGPNATIAVSDTGTGMTESTMEHLFEPFFTTKGPGQGTGLGLATVYGVVRQSGGSVWARTELGRGSTFTVYLPWVEAGPARTVGDQPTGVTAGRAPRSGTILVVEDDDGVRGFATRVLERAGYRVLSASGGAAALETYGGEPIDLLVTDVVMPSMSGREVADRLSARRPGLRVMFMSGHADATIGKHGVLDPDIRYLPKPFTAQSLILAVGDALQAPPAGPAEAS